MSKSDEAVLAEEVPNREDELTAAQRAQKAWADRERGRAVPSSQSPARRGQRSGDHRPYGSVVRKTADWEDPQREWFPTRGEVDPNYSDVTTTKFHPLELPDPEAQYDARMLPQIIPSHQIDTLNETHSLGESVPVDSPVRARFRK